VPVVEVPISGATRSNVAVVEADGTTSKFNDLGPTLSSTELEALEERTTALADRADWVVTGGSLPSECPDDLHARLVRSGHRAGARVAVDVSGPPLAQAGLAGPDLVKPNLAELAEWADRPLDSLGDVHEAAHQLRAAGVAAVLVSLGEHGALLVEEAGTWHATGTASAVRSTVGAGDAMLAGFLLAGGSGPSALRAAVSYGTAAVELPGSRMPGPHHLRADAVRVHELDESLSLTGVAA
jgi:1-phosphofructokinase